MAMGRTAKTSLRIAAVLAPIVARLLPLLLPLNDAPPPAAMFFDAAVARESPEPPLVDFRAIWVLQLLLIAVPTCIVLGEGIARWRRGRLIFDAPVLWALGVVVIALEGLASGLAMANAGRDIVLQDTYYVVAHYHYTLLLSAAFATFAGFYFWFADITGWRYSAMLAKLHFWVTFVGTGIAFFPQHFVSLAAMPRRAADYPDAFANWNLVSSIGAFIAGLGFLIFLAML